MRRLGRELFTPGRPIKNCSFFAATIRGFFVLYLVTVQTYRFYIILISFLLGVAFATLLGTSLPLVTWFCLVALGLMVVGSRRREALTTAAVTTLSLATLALALGMLRFEVASWQFGHSILEQHVGHDIRLLGEVTKEPEVKEHTINLYVKTSQGTILVSTDKYTNVAYGDEVLIQGTLKKPEAFETELGRTFNYPGYLLARGVEYQITLAEIIIKSNGHGNKFLAALFRLKHTLIHSIESVLPEPYAGLGQGLLLGVKQAIGKDLEAAFRTSGIIHIVVLSGHNVMIVVSFVLVLLSFFLAKRARIVVGLGVIVCFALLVGLSATVVRASLMASLLLFADFIGRRYDLARALLSAGVVMVCFNPYLLIYDIGFQLSFMATLGLILVAPIFESFITDGFSKLTVRDYLISTIATQIAVLPLLIYHIGEVSLVAVVVNLLVLPMVPLAMLLTFLAGLITSVSLPLAFPISFLAYLSLRYIIEVATFFAGLPLSSFIVPAIPAWLLLVLYIALAYVVFRFKTGPREDDMMRGWVIEEEDIIKVGVGLHPASTKTELPIFFR